jgi:two-component system, chemotaxis family, CheB/CheR fusion protein
MAEADITIVGIGASAGGLDAFRSFFEHMPSDSGMAFVVILHLPADYKSMLPDILERWTSMPVVPADDGTAVEPNSVYVPTPHSAVAFVEGCLRVREPNPGASRILRPIDDFFDSLARELREWAVGIVLSGTGSDGALGLKAIKECGGLTIAQGGDGNGPQYAEMPAGAIATGSVDLIAAAEQMPEHLLRIRAARAAALESPTASAEQIDAARLEICALLMAQLGHDFSGYRDKTFLRRVQRRMHVVNAPTLEAYVARLRADSVETKTLFRDLLIGVTSFFRDQDTFTILEEHVIPQLFEGKHADGIVRVWVPGCATGEEAYSLAILLREHMDRLAQVPRVQVFATDIDDAAITTARLGRYPETLLAGLSSERRARFFRGSEGSYVVAKEVRELCTFSSHNLVRDPPFSRMDLVSCRNLLIYLDAELQAVVIPIFHYAMSPGGILLLGGSESVARHPALFEPLHKTARIFRRLDGKSPNLQLRMRSADLVVQAADRGRSRASVQAAPASSASSPGHSTQATGPEWPAGTASMAIGQRCGSWLSRLGRRWGGSRAESDEREPVRAELRRVEEQLQSLKEEHQTALEELRSSNEELHSVNEEMQSANEELETSHEELQALNEELNTVNARLNEKVDELDAINNDLRNLFESTEIATIFLDRHLVIRSFTPAIATLYNLIPSDQGRPLTDIVSRLQYDRLRDDVSRVLESREPLERRIARADQGAHYVMRIVPYRGPDSAVSGALVTFIDVTSIVQAETSLRDADVRKDIFLATLSHELRNPLAPIRTAARLLESADLDPTHVARARAIIARQVSHMSSLLDDLLDVSRITRGSFVLKKQLVDLEDLIDAAVEAVQPAVDARNHTLRIERPAKALMLEVDPVRITQVLSNLLTNATKYTPVGGEIAIGARLESPGLAMFVRDNGIGLAPEMITRVFEMFNRVQTQVDRSEGGLGIGLALVKGLVELHGGRVVARSAGLGLGSEFVVSLPSTAIVHVSPPTHGAGEHGQRHMVRRRVLVVDDNRDGADALKMYLQLAGQEVLVAYSGNEALEAAAEWHPDVVVLDIGMPGLSGYEVAKRLRERAWGAPMRLIALTGWGQEHDKRLAAEAGFDHHVTKPVDPEHLVDLMSGDH